MELITIENEKIFLPEDKLTLVNYGKLEKSLISNMKNFCEGKRKSNINIYDQGNIILSEEIYFFSITSLQDLDYELAFNKNSLLKEYIECCIVENDTMFSTLNKVLDLIKESYSDQGFIQLHKKLSEGLSTSFEFSYENMTIEKLIALVQVNIQHLCINDKLILITNILGEVYKDRYLFIYIGESIMEINENFISSIYQTNKRRSILLNMNCIRKLSIFVDYSPNILIMEDLGNIEEVQVHASEIMEYIYASLETTKKNYNFQQEKTKKIMDYLTSIDNNFLIKVNDIVPKIL